MKTFTREELAEIVSKHDLWLNHMAGGERANLSRADLREADLSRANLRMADLSRADLSKSDLVGDGGPLVPVVANLHGKILAAIDNGGALDMAHWHVCGTTHCRGGWNIHFAGERGKALEEKYGANVAASLIVLCSCPWMTRVPNWFASNEDAMNDIRECVKLEAE